MDKLLNENEVANIFNVSVRTLQRVRAQGIGPRWMRIGRQVRYDLHVVLDFIKNQRPAPNGTLNHLGRKSDVARAEKMPIWRDHR